MSTRKQHISNEVRQPQQPTGLSSQTPSSRYAPSTPHALRALQQRSAFKTRSVQRTQRRRAFGDTLSANNASRGSDGANSIVRPDSARGILRRLAKLTAPVSKRIVATPVGSGKENQLELESVMAKKRSRLGLDIEDSLEEGDEEMVRPEVGEDEEDSELPVVPTPSILPDDDGDDTGHRTRWLSNGHGQADPTITFKSIDFGNRAQQSTEDGLRRRTSRLSFPASDPAGDVLADDDDPTILTEIGRRAISEEPTGRLSRYSFGSIRMDDFGSELEIRRESDQQQEKFKGVHNVLDDYVGVGIDDLENTSFDYAEETERLRNAQRSPTLPPPDESTINIPALDESFQLEIPDLEAAAQHARPGDQAHVTLLPPTTEVEESMLAHAGPEAIIDEQTELVEEPALATRLQAPASRRKRLKMTRHGAMIPSLPSSLIKRVAVEAQARQGMRKAKLGREHMKALEQATEWFFEQVGEDLEAYSDHARRKKRIDTSDVLMLMRRQRVLKGRGELMRAAKEVLPKKVLAELDLPEEI